MLLAKSSGISPQLKPWARILFCRRMGHCTVVDPCTQAWCDLRGLAPSKACAKIGYEHAASQCCLKCQRISQVGLMCAPPLILPRLLQARVPVSACSSQPLFFLSFSCGLLLAYDCSNGILPDTATPPASPSLLPLSRYTLIAALRSAQDSHHRQTLDEGSCSKHKLLLPITCLKHTLLLPTMHVANVTRARATGARMATRERVATSLETIS